MDTHPDKTRILALCGPTKVAKMLGYDQKPGGPQRVQNWMHRGIPSHVKVAFPHLFLQPAAAGAPTTPVDGADCAPGP
jgi:hypothetical protein